MDWMGRQLVQVMRHPTAFILFDFLSQFVYEFILTILCNSFFFFEETIFSSSAWSMWRRSSVRKKLPLALLISELVSDEYLRLYNSPSSRMLFPEKAVQVQAHAPLGVVCTLQTHVVCTLQTHYNALLQVHTERAADQESTSEAIKKLEAVVTSKLHEVVL